jgi:tetratricopeptide repeat protein
MKFIHIITAISILLTTGCTHKLATPSAIPLNMEVKDNNGNIILLGKSTRDRLAQPPFNTWFDKYYTEYAIDSNTANQLKPLVKHKRFLIFMGTWCGDSRREVPRMYKLLDYLGVPPSQVQLINVNNHDSAYKQSPGHEEKGLNIHRVPDLLIYDSSRELGRVVESPVISWEKDVFAILNRLAYQPRYKAVSWLIPIWQQYSLAQIQNNLPHIANTLKPLAANRGELLSYGKTLLASEETEKALLVMELNTLLFEADAEAWNGLAAACLKKGNKNKAVECYQKAISLQADNATAKNMLQQLNNSGQ